MQLKWIVLASICSFAVVSVGRSMVTQAPDDGLGYILASYPSKDSCLTGAADRIASCAEDGCYRNAWVFLDQCLAVADGDATEFCRNVTRKEADAAGRDIFGAHCMPFTSDEAACRKIIHHVGSFCANPPNE